MAIETPNKTPEQRDAQLSIEKNSWLSVWHDLKYKNVDVLPTWSQGFIVWDYLMGSAKFEFFCMESRKEIAG